MPQIVNLAERFIEINIIRNIKSITKQKLLNIKRRGQQSLRSIEVVKLIESPRKLREEIKKCRVLCANYHRDLHYKNKQAGIV